VNSFLLSTHYQIYFSSDDANAIFIGNPHEIKTQSVEDGKSSRILREPHAYAAEILRQ
jgi:hypothetical protein